MEIIAEEDVIGADEWHSVVAQSREAASQQIAIKAEEFLARGGVINIIQNGVTSNRWINSFNGTVLTTNKADRFSAAQVKTYTRKRSEKKIQETAASDKPLVEALSALLDDAPNTTYITEQLKRSHDLVQRLLTDYFADDPRADKFRRKERDVLNQENELALVEKIRDALSAGLVGVWSIAKHLHSSHHSITAVNKKYKLNIPRATTGRKVEVQS